MDYTVSYRLGSGPRLDVAYELTAREPVQNVLGSLVETVRLDPGTAQWCVSTAEGFLHDWAVARVPRDIRYTGLYARGTGDRVWQSRDIPFARHAPFIATRSGSGRWTVIRFAEGLPENVMLKMRLGDTGGPHLRVEWLDGAKPVGLARGQTLLLRYSVETRACSVDELRAMCEEQPADAAGAAISIHTRGSRYEVSNGRYDLALTRWGGGRLADLRLHGDTQPLLAGSRIYTDGGIYGDRTLPAGEQIRQFVSSDSDPETEVAVGQTERSATLAFRGLLRDSDGRGIPGPRTFYETCYRLDTTDALTASLRVKTNATIPAARAFLAQTLGVPQLASYAVNARGKIMEGTPQPGADRVWESKREGFGTEPWMVCRAGGGRQVRVAGPALASAFQNAFLLGGPGPGVIFLAFNDFEPADITPVWREASYTITPSREGQ
jgi:hypothetical protein